jgi:hypothetical protein
MVARLRIAGRIAALGLLSVLLSACLKLDMNLEVSADNTVSGTVIFAVQKQILELAGGSVDDLLSEAPIPADAPGVTISDYDDDEFSGKQFTFDAVPLAEFSGATEAELQITREGDVFHVSGTLDLSSGLSGATGVSGFDPSTFLQGAQLQIRITFPGEVSESNGQIDGNTVTWVPEIGQRLDLQATASAIESGGGSSMMLLLIIGAVVVIAIVLVVVMSQRRKQLVVAAAGMGDVAAPPAAAGGMAPPSAEAAPSPPGDAAPPPPPPPGPPDQA